MTLRLRSPVQTLDKRQLLPSGTLVSEETLEAMISRSPYAPSEISVLLEYGSVRDDMVRFFSYPPYHVIFAHPRIRARLLDIMKTVHLAYPLLEILDYFKEYDFYTYRHILMVFALSSLLAHDLVEDRQDLIREVVSGPSHDFGKICVPLSILKKTQPLTRDERNILEQHAVAGYVLLSYYLRDPRTLAARMARDHHERNDGSGYPLGIHLADRLVEILAASDVYDALISPRPYRPTSYDNRTALEEITGMAERGELSWEVVQALVAHNREGRSHFSEVVVSREKRGSAPPDSVYGVIADEDTHARPEA